MNEQEKQTETLFGKYSDMLKVRSARFFFEGGSKWEQRKINKFLKYFCIPMKEEETVALLDTTLFRTAKEGMLFVKKGIVIKEPLSRLYYLEYEKISRAELREKYNDAGHLTESKLFVVFKDGTEKLIFDYYVRKNFFVDYLNEVARVYVTVQP